MTSKTASERAREPFLRARRPEQKQQRQEAILSAARALALADGVRSVSLAGIAARAGIDKSALLRYFETREQIFLELTAREWGPWVQALRDGLDGLDRLDGFDGAGGPGGREAAGLVADVVARSFGDRPLFCDLLAHTPLNLERNVSPENVRRYKLTSLAAVDDAAAVVHRVLPDLTAGECREFISALASLAGSVWQIANPVPALAALFAADPALELACVDLTPRLRRTGDILLAGLIPSRPALPAPPCQPCLTGPRRRLTPAGRRDMPVEDGARGVQRGRDRVDRRRARRRVRDGGHHQVPQRARAGEEDLALVGEVAEERPLGKPGPRHRLLTCQVRFWARSCRPKSALGSVALRALPPAAGRAAGLS